MTRMSFRAAAAIGTVALAAAAVSGTTATATPDQVARPSESTVAAASAVTSADARVSQRAAKHGYKVTTFKMVRSPGIVRANCLPKARARVVITSGGQNEVMKVYASGLPKKTEFDFFVLQVPDFPFGLSWYQGDLKTNKHGRAYAKFVGRFNEETFTIAPGVPAPAPVVHDSPTADASTNPVTAPVHQYHLGFWFNSPKDAKAAGCSASVTPFNGEHNAGTQAMNTRQFAPDDGPLGRIGS